MRDFSILVCPSCRRKAFTRRDLFYAGLDGTARCRACGRSARLDLLGRWMISCMIALVLPSVLLYGDVFYSGHLFIVSMLIILSAWRILSWLAFPILTLEAVPDDFALGRKQSILVFAVLLVLAIAFDSYMAARFDPNDALEPERGAAYRLLNTSGFTKFCAS